MKKTLSAAVGPDPRIAKRGLGLAGYDRPSRGYIAAPIKDKRPLGVIVQEWASKEKLKTGVRWKDIDDAQMKTITTEAKANALGVPYAYAKRVVAKISRLVAARSKKLLVTRMHGKIIRKTEVRRVAGPANKARKSYK
jgi:hypothetical protein